MWTSFVVAFALGVIILYVPGLLLGKTFRFQTAFSIALAPVISIFCYEVLAIAYQKLGIFSSFYSLFVPVTGFAIVVLLVSLCVKKLRRQPLASNPLLPKANVALQLLYVLVGVFFGVYFFLNAIGSADAFCQEWDNGFHLNAIRSFVDSGNYSTLVVDAYGDSAQTPYGSNSTGSFYPAAWHLLCAMITSLTGATVTISMNAVNFLCATALFQSGMYCLFEKLFSDNRYAVYSGLLIVSAFTTFPWKFLSYGPIYPNLLSMALLPISMLVFMLLIDRACSVRQRVLLAATFIVCCFVLAVSQTNTIFAAIVLLWPYLAVQVYKRVEQKFLPIASPRKRRALFYSLMALLLILLWVAMYNMPAFQGLYATVWASTAGEVQTIVNILTASYRASAASFLLGILILIGGYRSYKSSDHGWLLCSYVIVCFLLLVDMATDGLLKQFLVGIWYTDQHRVAALAAVVAMPLASLGLAALIEKFFEFKKNGGLEHRALKPATITVLLAMAIVLGLYCPSFNIQGVAKVETPFGAFAALTSDEYADTYIDDSNFTEEGKLKNADGTVKTIRTYLDTEEQDFLDEVAQVTSVDNALVVNSPFDGSVFAYGLDGINVFYKTMFAFDDGGQTTQSQLIKHKLNEVSWNAAVQDAVQELGVEYVLLLDYSKEESGIGMYSTFSEVYWDGIVSITDKTPGFETVLKEGDMRLYRVVY